MSPTRKMLREYVGRPVSVLLADEPFTDWVVERSEPEPGDLDAPKITFTFPGRGLEVRCGLAEEIGMITLCPEEDGAVGDSLTGIAFSASREEVRARYGSPTDTGTAFHDPVLGDYGPWDRFDGERVSLHVEYRRSGEGIARMTLMRGSWVPRGAN